MEKVNEKKNKALDSLNKNYKHLNTLAEELGLTEIFVIKFDVNGIIVTTKYDDLLGKPGVVSEENFGRTFLTLKRGEVTFGAVNNEGFAYLNKLP